MKNKILIIIFVLSIITPYVSNILLIREFDLSFLILIPIFLISLIGLIVSTRKITIIESKKKSIIYKIVSLSFVLIFFLTYGQQIRLSEYFSYQRNKVELRKLVDKISGSNIRIMTDDYENLNGYPINNWGFEPEYPLDSILAIYNIDKQEYEDLRFMLKSIKYRSISKSEDGIIFLTKGGIIDNCYGIAYSQEEKSPVENNCGKIIKWRRIIDNWYAWATT